MRALGLASLVVAGAALLLFVGKSSTDSRIAVNAAPDLGRAEETRTPEEPGIERSDKTDRLFAESSNGVAALPDTGAALEKQGPALGVLLVSVVSRETKAPLQGIRLMALVEDTEDEKLLRVNSANRGTEHDVLVTDDAGTALFSFPSGRKIELDAWEEEKGDQRLRTPIEPLEPLETREELVELSTEHDLAYFGRLSENARHPLFYRQPAEVLLRAGGWTLDTEQPDWAGAFQFLTDSWRNPYLRIETYGFTPALVRLTKDHTTESTREVIALEPAGELQIQVLEGLNPVPGIEVVARAAAEDLVRLRYHESWLCREEFEWSGTTNEQGWCLLSNLAAQVPLHLALDGSGLQRIEEPLVLSPGEERKLALVLDPPVELRGRISDQHGEPIADKEVWLCERTERPLERWGCAFGPFVQSAVTDTAGFFSFARVYEGVYWIGPSPACPPLLPGFGGSSNAQRVVPKVFLAEVGAGESKELELQVDRELFLRGVVIEEHHWKMPGVTVSARSMEFEDVEEEATTDEHGRFEIGPLESGMYELRARTSIHYLHESPLLIASAGRDGLLLRVTIPQPDGRITGFVVDPAEGHGIEAAVVLLEGIGTWTAFEGVTPYVIATATGDLEREELHLPKGLPWARQIMNRGQFPDWIALVPSLADRTSSDPQTGAFVFEDVLRGDYTVLAATPRGYGIQQVTLNSERGQVDGLQVFFQSGVEFDVETGWSSGRAGVPAETEEWRLVLRDRRKGDIVLDHSFSGSQTILHAPPGDYRAELTYLASGLLDWEEVRLRLGERCRLVFSFW